MRSCTILSSAFTSCLWAIPTLAVPSRQVWLRVNHNYLRPAGISEYSPKDVVYPNSIAIVVEETHDMDQADPDFQVGQVFDIAELNILAPNLEPSNYLPTRGIDTKIVGRQLDFSTFTGNQDAAIQINWARDSRVFNLGRVDFTEASNQQLQDKFRFALSRGDFSLGLRNGESRGTAMIAQDFIEEGLNIMLSEKILKKIKQSQEYEDKFAPRLNPETRWDSIRLDPPSERPQAVKIRHLIVQNAEDGTLQDVPFEGPGVNDPDILDRSVLDRYQNMIAVANGPDVMSNPHKIYIVLQGKRLLLDDRYEIDLAAIG